MEFSPETVVREKQADKVPFQLPELTTDGLEAEIESLLARQEILTLEYADADPSRRAEIDEEMKSVSSRVDELHRSYEMLVDPSLRMLREELAKKFHFGYLPPFEEGENMVVGKMINGESLVITKDGKKFGPFAFVSPHMNEDRPFIRTHTDANVWYALYPNGSLRRLGKFAMYYKDGIAACKDNEDDLYVILDRDGKEVFSDLRVRDITSSESADFFVVHLDSVGNNGEKVDDSASRVLTSRGLSSRIYDSIQLKHSEKQKAFQVSVKNPNSAINKSGYIDTSGELLFYEADDAPNWDGMGALGKIVAKRNAQGEQEGQGEEWKVILGDLSMHPDAFEDTTSPRNGMIGVASINKSGKKEWYVMNAEGVVVGGPYAARPTLFAGFARTLPLGAYEYCFRDGRKAGPFKSVPTSDVPDCCIHTEESAVSIITPAGACVVPIGSVIETTSDAHYRAEVRTENGDVKNVYATQHGFFGPVSQVFDSHSKHAQGFVLRQSNGFPSRDTKWFLCKDTGVLLGPFEHIEEANEYELVVYVPSGNDTQLKRIVIDREGVEHFTKDGEEPVKNSWHLGYVPVNGILNGEPYSYVDMKKK